MNATEATQLAKTKYGDQAFAVRVQSRDRNQRFGIMMVDGGAVFALGYGASFLEAFEMADKEVKLATEAVLLEEKQKKEQAEYEASINTNKEVK